MARVVTLVVWFARISAVLLLLLWGSFFIDHLTEWFKISGPRPPWTVIVIQMLHFLLLLGYILVLKWRFFGSLLILGSAAAFFGSIGGSAMASFFVVSILPAGLFLLVYYFEKKISSEQMSEQKE